MTNILLAEPCPVLKDTVKRAVDSLSANVVDASNINDAIHILEKDKFNVILLCPGMGTENIIQVITTLRRGANCPVVGLLDDNNSKWHKAILGHTDGLISSTKRPGDIAAGLKPYLVTRTPPPERPRPVMSQMRRHPVSQRLQFDNFVFDLSRFGVCIKGGEFIALPVSEFRLLEWILMHPNQTFRRYELCEVLAAHGFSPTETSINTKILRIRKKLLPYAKNPEFIRTVHGIGYICEEDVEVVNSSQEGLK